MANIKLGDDILTGVNQLKVKNADDLTQLVAFTEGNGKAYTAGNGIDITNDVISTKPVELTFSTTQILQTSPLILQLTNKQANLIENSNIINYFLKLTDLGLGLVNGSAIKSQVKNNIIKLSLFWSDGDNETTGQKTGWMTYTKDNKRIRLDKLDIQNKLTAGSGIDISNNTISITGGLVTDAIRYDTEQNLTEVQKNQAKRNQGLYYIGPKAQVMNWDGNTTGKYTINSFSSIKPLPSFTGSSLIKINDDTSWFDPANKDIEYSLKLGSIDTVLATWDGTGKDPITVQVAQYGQETVTKNLYKVYDPEVTAYFDSIEGLGFTLQSGSKQYFDSLEASYVTITQETTEDKSASAKAYYNDNIYIINQPLNSEVVPGVYCTKWTESGINNFIKTVLVDQTHDIDKQDKIIDFQEFVASDFEIEGTGKLYLSITDLQPSNYTSNYCSYSRGSIGYYAVMVVTEAFGDFNIGTYFGYKNSSIHNNSTVYTAKLHKQPIAKLPEKNSSNLILHASGSVLLGESNGENCDVDFDSAKEAFLNGVDVLLYDTITEGSHNNGYFDRTIVYKAVEYIPEINSYLGGERSFSITSQLRFIGIDYSGYRDRYRVASVGGNSDSRRGTMAGRVRLVSKLFCKVIKGETGIEFIRNSDSTWYEDEDPILHKLSMLYWIDSSQNNNYNQNFIIKRADGNTSYTIPQYYFQNNSVNTDVNGEELAKGVNEYDELTMISESYGESYGSNKKFTQDLHKTGYQMPVNNDDFQIKWNYYNPSIDSYTPQSWINWISPNEKQFNYQKLHSDDNQIKLTEEGDDWSYKNTLLTFNSYLRDDNRYRPRFNLLQTTECPVGIDENGYDITLQRISTKQMIYEPGVPYLIPMNLYNKGRNIARSNMGLPYDIYTDEIIWNGDITDRAKIDEYDYYYSRTGYYFVSSKIYTIEELLTKYYTQVTLGDSLLGDQLDTYNGDVKTFSIDYIEEFDDDTTGFMIRDVLQVITDAKSSGLPTGTYFYKEKIHPSTSSYSPSGNEYKITRNILNKKPTNLLDPIYIKGGHKPKVYTHNISMQTNGGLDYLMFTVHAQKTTSLTLAEILSCLATQYNSKSVQSSGVLLSGSDESLKGNIIYSIASSNQLKVGLNKPNDQNNGLKEVVFNTSASDFVLTDIVSDYIDTTHAITCNLSHCTADENNPTRIDYNETKTLKFYPDEHYEFEEENISIDGCTYEIQQNYDGLEITITAYSSDININIEALGESFWISTWRIQNCHGDDNNPQHIRYTQQVTLTYYPNNGYKFTTAGTATNADSTWTISDNVATVVLSNPTGDVNINLSATKIE